MKRVFAPRNLITNRRGIAHGNLKGEDVDLVARLRRQVAQLTTGKAEEERNLMNALASIEKRKDYELNSTKARIKLSEEANHFLKVSKNSLVEMVLDLEVKVERLKLVEVKEGNDRRNHDQGTNIEKLNSTQTSINSNKKTIQEAVQQLDGKGGKDQMAENYNSAVKRNTLLEEQIQRVVAREDTTNQRLVKIEKDANDLLFRQYIIIDTLKKEVTLYKENKIKLERELLSYTERMGDIGIIKLLTRQLDEKHAELINSHKELAEKEKERKELIKRENDTITHLSKEHKLVTTNLLEQLQQRDAVINQMAQAADNSLSCQKDISEQIDAEEIDGLNVELRQRNMKIELKSFKKKQIVSSFKQRGVHQLQQKDTIINQMPQVADNLLSCQKDVSEQKYAEEIDGLDAEFRQKNTKIECKSFKKKHIVTSFKQRGGHHMIQKHQSKLEKLAETRNISEMELEQTNDETEQIGNQNLQEDSLQKNVLKQKECVRNRGLEGLELKRSLHSQLLYATKLQIDMNLEDLLHLLKRKIVVTQRENN